MNEWNFTNTANKTRLGSAYISDVSCKPVYRSRRNIVNYEPGLLGFHIFGQKSSSTGGLLGPQKVEAMSDIKFCAVFEGLSSVTLNEVLESILE